MTPREPVRAPSEERTLTVSSDEAGLRLDAFLARRLGVARAEARRWIAAGAVQVGGRAARKGVLVAPEQRVTVSSFVPPGEHAPIPQPELALRVLAEGPGWIAVDKPAGMAVHPLRPHERGTVANALAARHSGIARVGEGGLRGGVVHRLDVDTSGVLLFATRHDAWERLRAGFREHRAHKRYLALVAGCPRPEGRAELPLVVARHRPARVRVARPEEVRAGRGRPTGLTWRVLEPLGEAALLEVVPRTGFLHQIRATLAHLGHPVLGDARYAGPPAPAGARRPLLHAAALELDGVRAESPLPADFVAARDALRAAARAE